METKLPGRPPLENRETMRLHVEYMDGKIDNFEPQKWSYNPSRGLDITLSDGTLVIVPIISIRKYWMEKVNA
jgi:hypothetical protein